MLSFLSNLVPKNWLLASTLVLGLICTGGYFYYNMQLSKADLAVAQAELVRVNDKLELQKKTIQQMAEDAKKQAKLIEEYNDTVDDIRKKAVDEINEISNADLGKEANSDAKALEDSINIKMKKLFDDISEASK
jgi:hypothetical protein